MKPKKPKKQKPRVKPIPPPFPGLDGNWYLVEDGTFWGVMTSEQAQDLLGKR